MPVSGESASSELKKVCPASLQQERTKETTGGGVKVRIHLKQTTKNTIPMISVRPIFEHPYRICNFCFRVTWCLWGQDLILNRMCLWCSCFLWDSFSSPLVTFSLFAVVSILLQLGPFCPLRMLPLLCVVWLSSGRVWLEGDDDAGHVVTACTISRCVWGQTVVQQLPRGDMRFEIKDAKIYLRFVVFIWLLV